ncbi:MAG: HD domain-containing protein [Bacteroidales bacterium]
MDINNVAQILDPQFGYWAKSNGELLYTHHFTVWSIFRKLAGLCPSLDEKEKEEMEIACLVHDIGKMKDENQKKLKNNEDMVEHRIEMNDLKEYFGKVESLRNIDEENIQKIRDIIHTHHSVAEHDLSEIVTAGASFFTNLLRTVDYIASMENISFETLYRLRELYKDKIDFTYFSFSRFASPTTFTVVNNLIKSYKEKGWTLLRTFENGAIFVSKPKTPLPEKTFCVSKISKVILKESLSLQKSFPTGYTGDFLTLLSKEYSDIFLECNKEQIINALGNKDQKAVVFFKLARDILSARDLVPDKLTRNLIEGKINNPWILGVLESANSTSAHKYSKELFKKFTGNAPPEKVNRDMIDPLFDMAKIEDLFPESLDLPQDKSTRLKTLKPNELFELLQAIAKPPENKKQKSDLEEYIFACISMDEETNFRKIAEMSFKMYCSYKKTSDAEKGVCERCGCPVSKKMQPALNLSQAPQSFSQIKAEYNYRAICALCGLDNLILRKDVRSNQSRVYLRLETKVPDLFFHYQEIKRLIGLVATGVRNPRQIVRFKERTDLGGLPFPERIEIPIGPEKWADKLAKDPVLQGDNGVLFIVGRDIRQEDFSPKDLRAQYEPLYHIMKYLGFKVSLGAEEQEGLFGEEVLTDEKGENYYLSLATILLANIIGKTQKQFIFARNLILNSPSTVLMSLVDMQGSNEEFELYSTHLIKALKKANVKIITYEGGELNMDGLLKDAAFFADKEKGIPHFCVEPEERGDFWKDLTKHKAGKPVAQALDAILSGLSFDIAMERFMRNLSVKIGQEEQSELSNFVNRAKEIIKRYYEIRKSDLSGFLKAKNSLISAIYILTRYQNLKEVADE